MTEFARLSQREWGNAPKAEPQDLQPQGGQAALPRQTVSCQVGAKPQGGRPEGGSRAAARILGSPSRNPPRADHRHWPDAVKAKAVISRMTAILRRFSIPPKHRRWRAEILTLERRAERAPVSACDLDLRRSEIWTTSPRARWRSGIKERTPNDCWDVIDVGERAAVILRDEMQAERREAVSKELWSGDARNTR